MKRKFKNILLIYISASALVYTSKDSQAEDNKATLHYIKADDPNIQYSGRIDFTNPKKPTFTYPGICIKAKFTGTSIDLVMKDYSEGGEKNTNYYNVFLDNGADTLVLGVNRTDTIYKLFSGLKNGEHTIEVFKRTESSVGKSSFMGFLIENKKLLPPSAKPSRKMEFIGNSITCGYGNEVSTNSPGDFTSVNENNYKAYGALTSRKLNAQYMCVSYSGIGMYRNASGATNNTMPLRYDRIFPDEPSPLWNFANYTPDVVVVNLGTNDFFLESKGIPVDSALYVGTYIKFVSTLRSKYPSAKIVCVVGSMMSDYWPQGRQALTRIKSFIKEVINQRQINGDKEIYFCKLSTQSAPWGEGYHPSAVTHERMAEELTAFIKSITGW